MTKSPAIDQPTLQILKRMLNTPPKPHDEMKIGKAKASRAKKPTKLARKAKKSVG